MQSVGAFHAKTHFSALLEQVGKGEHIIITKHGHAVAKLVPVVEAEADPAHILEAIDRLQKFSQSHRLAGLDWKALRDEGRR